jgi:hypothetical protein
VAETTYTYEKLCATDRLTKEIQESAILTALDRIETVSSPATTNVIFKDALSEGDETILDSLVSAHVATPLPENEVIPVKPLAFPDPDGKRARLYGTHFADCLANDDTEIDYTVPADRLIDGAEYLLSGGQLGDYVDFEVRHPSLGLLDPFCTRWYVKDGHAIYKLYPAYIPAGLVIRVVYHNTGANPAKFALNLFLHAIS